MLGLIFKGMNDYCAREISAFNECRFFYASEGASLESGLCGKERELMGTCRLLVSDSIANQCKAELSALTLAVGKKEESGVVQALTDRLYRCGMTPVPGLNEGPRRLPARLEEGVLQVIEAERQRKEFVKVVSKQLEHRYQAKHGGGAAAAAAASAGHQSEKPAQ